LTLTESDRAFGLTSLSTGFMPIAVEFNVSTTVSILAFSIYLFGVSFAPIYSPHVAGDPSPFLVSPKQPS
jgi:hypothetical protein